MQASGQAPRGQTGQPWKAGARGCRGPAAVGWILAPGVVQAVCPSGHPEPRLVTRPRGQTVLCHKDHTEVVFGSILQTPHSTERRVGRSFSGTPSTSHASCSQELLWPRSGRDSRPHTPPLTQGTRRHCQHPAFFSWCLGSVWDYGASHWT